MSNKFEASERQCAGLVPAAGFATRLPGLAGSKEMLEVGGEPAIGHLLRAFRNAGVAETRVVLRQGKWDIPEFLAGPDWQDLNIRYHVTRGTSGVPETVALGLQGLTVDTVLFGFPDILFEPSDAFFRLRNRLHSGDADVVLGLFPTQTPSKMDMVEIDGLDRVVAIEIKPDSTALELTWITAAWRKSFTEYFLSMQQDTPERIRQRAGPGGDPHIGHVLQLAMDDGLVVTAVRFGDGRSLDIGTPEDLDRARGWHGKDDQR